MHLHHTTPLRTCTAPPGPTLAATLAATLALALPTLADAQDAEDAATPLPSEIELLRNRPRLTFGAGVVTGNTAFDSNPLVIKADLGQIPSASIGLRFWPEEYAGLDLSYQGAFLGGVNVSQLEAVEGDSTLRLTHHRLEADFRYRLFSSPRPDAIELGPRLGFLLHTLVPSDHSPNLLVSTTYFGPTLGAFLRLPFAEGTFGLDLDADAILPFFVRESPVGSGRPDSAFGYHLGIAPFLRISTSLFVALRADLRAFSADFTEQGERFGGVTQGTNDDSFLSLRATLDWIL